MLLGVTGGAGAGPVSEAGAFSGAGAVLGAGLGQFWGSFSKCLKMNQQTNSLQVPKSIKKTRVGASVASIFSH